MMKNIIKLNKEEINELEMFIRKRIEHIVFNTRRSRAKVKGGHEIDDDTGNLRRKIKAARNFIKQDKRGIKIDFPTTEYFKYLDDERREELNWYLSEAIFEDKQFRTKLRDIYKQSGQRAFVNIIEGISD